MSIGFCKGCWNRVRKCPAARRPRLLLPAGKAHCRTSSVSRFRHCPFNHTLPRPRGCYLTNLALYTPEAEVKMSSNDQQLRKKKKKKVGQTGGSLRQACLHTRVHRTNTVAAPRYCSLSHLTTPTAGSLPKGAGGGIKKRKVQTEVYLSLQSPCFANGPLCCCICS